MNNLVSLLTKGNPWPARLDLLQSTTGLFLGVFLCVHTFLVASILLGPEAMWRVSRFFEGYYFFGRSYPALVVIFAAVVFLVFITHAAAALHKFPANSRQWIFFWRHARTFRHTDTTLWLVQVVTGFLLFLLGPIHLYAVLTHPAQIEPLGASDRVWSGIFWPLDLLLILVVVPHMCIGLYRLALKWCCATGYFRILTRRAMWLACALFLSLDLASLGTYIRIGIEHAPHVGEPYVPEPLFR
ncbi:MAG: fumarate reductase cytochrome b subunit [Pseudomonadota bacterium]